MCKMLLFFKIIVTFELILQFDDKWDVESSLIC